MPLLQLVSLDESSLPARLRRLTVAGGGLVEVRLLNKAFLGLRMLERASFSRLRRLLVRHHAFYNASRVAPDGPQGLQLEVSDSEQ